MNHMRLAQLFIVFVFLIPVGIHASWVEGNSGHSKARLISQNSSINDEVGEILIGVEIQLDKGWHTYWKNPGDLGRAPSQVEWELPENWSASPFLFPVPQVFEDRPDGQLQTSFGYKDKAYYLAYLSHTKNIDSSDDLEIGVSFNFLICKELCIPESFRLKGKIERGKLVYSREANLLTELASRIPFPSSAARTVWNSETSFDVYFLEEDVREIFIYAGDEYSKFWMATKLDEEEALKSGAISAFQVELSKPLENLEITAALGDPQKSTGIVYRVPPRIESSSTGFALILLFAFLGGLILNLMPCVLPVLFLKANSLIALSGKTEKVRSSLVLTILGILTSFLAIGVLTASLKSLGYAVAWGFQFQNAGFMSFILIVVFIFALSLFSVFEFQLPNSLNKSMAEKTGAFFEGVFATLLATPCTAPLLGVALAYALTQDVFSLFSLFTVMGMGLASPYILLAINPKLLKLMPKPGAWMNRLKNILGYGLLLTCVWFLSILFSLTQMFYSFILISGLILLFFIIREFRSPLRWVFAALLCVSLVVMSNRYAASEATTIASDSREIKITEFDGIQQSGESFFLYITADWCLTCKYNEASVIRTEWFDELTKSHNTKIYKVDWTNQDANVANFLETYGRVGIPFAMLVRGDEVKLFPELMTRSNTQEIFEEFSN